jgi:hypothetical protein
MLFGNQRPTNHTHEPSHEQPLKPAPKRSEQGRHMVNHYLGKKRVAHRTEEIGLRQNAPAQIHSTSQSSIRLPVHYCAGIHR